MKNGKVLEMLTGQEEEKPAKVTRGFLVEMTAFDYNDEYYSSTEYGTCRGDTVYFNREKAEAEAYKANLDHAREVLSDLYSWSYGEGWLDIIRQDAPSEEELHRLLKIFRPETGAAESPEQLREELSQINCPEDDVSDEDIAWLVKRFSFFRYAYVAEVQIDGAL